jgi:hypothetical protein
LLETEATIHIHCPRKVETSGRQEKRSQETQFISWKV